MINVGDAVVVHAEEYIGYTPGSKYNLPRGHGVVERGSSQDGYIEVRYGNYLSPAVNPSCFSLANGAGKTALDTQIGGSHYKSMPIQPMEYSMKNNLDACQHTIIKYVTRFREKGGIEDLEKAKHCIDLLIGFEREKSND